MDEKVKLVNGENTGGGGDGGGGDGVVVGEIKQEPCLAPTGAARQISEEEYVRASNKRSIGVLTEDFVAAVDCVSNGESGGGGCASSILLEAFLLNETNKGMLILNVKWRGRTYVGTLIDVDKSTWASPRFKEHPSANSNKLKNSASSASLNGNTNGFSSTNSFIFKSSSTYFIFQTLFRFKF